MLCVEVMVRVLSSRFLACWLRIGCPSRFIVERRWRQGLELGSVSASHVTRNQTYKLVRWLWQYIWFPVSTRIRWPTPIWYRPALKPHNIITPTAYSTIGHTLSQTASQKDVIMKEANTTQSTTREVFFLTFRLSSWLEEKKFYHPSPPFHFLDKLSTKFA